MRIRTPVRTLFSRSHRRAFTIVELLVVIGIIALLTVIGLPTIQGLAGGSTANSAARQLMDDLSFARLKAISERSSVYVVFLSPRILNEPWSPSERAEITKLLSSQYTSYAIYIPRTLGDQPGSGTPQYLTDWKSLPPGLLFETNEFVQIDNPNILQSIPPPSRPLPHYSVRFPSAKSSKEIKLPCIVFDYQGRLKLVGDEYIYFSKGSIVIPRDANNKPVFLAPEVIETPKGNSTNNPVIVIDWLTGRTRVEEPERRT